MVQILSSAGSSFCILSGSQKYGFWLQLSLHQPEGTKFCLVGFVGLHEQSIQTKNPVLIFIFAGMLNHVFAR